MLLRVLSLALQQEGRVGVCLQAGAERNGTCGEELRHRATELRRESGFNWAV